MDDGYTEWENEMEQKSRYFKTAADVYYWLYEGWAVYDDPWEAMLSCSVTSPKYCGGDCWTQWKHDHYVGHKNVEERALKDPYTRSYLKRFGLLPEVDEVDTSNVDAVQEMDSGQTLK